MTLKPLTPLIVSATLVLAMASTGCSSVAGNPNVANQDRNFLGLVKIQPHSYAEAPPTALIVHADEIISKPDMTGNKVSILNGLITFEDF